MNDDEEKRQRAIALNNYAPLNDSFWSSHNEVTKAAEYLLSTLKEQTELKGNGDIVKKHIQVLMLNLYSVWSADVDRYVTFYRRVNEYKAKDNRYNKLDFPVFARHQIALKSNSIRGVYEQQQAIHRRI